MSSKTDISDRYYWKHMQYSSSVKLFYSGKDRINLFSHTPVTAGPFLPQQRRVVQLQSFRLNWGTGQATFDPLVITALCTGPRRSRRAIREGSRVQKMDSFRLARGARHRLYQSGQYQKIYRKKKKNPTSKLHKTRTEPINRLWNDALRHRL